MRKNVIVGIHGLGEKPPEHVLHSWWVQSIQEGAQRWNIGLTDFDVKLVYWPDILHPVPLNPRESDQESPLYLDAPYVPSMQEAPTRPHNLKKRIVGFLEKKLSALLLNDDLSINYQSVTDTLVRRYFKDLDAYFSSDTGPDGPPNNTTEKIRDRLIRVLEKHKDDRILLVAHSMGSIVAFDVLEMNPHLQVDTLVTVGSPLGFPVVVGRMVAERNRDGRGENSMQVPDSIKTAWYNHADIEDYVAIDSNLANDFRANNNGVKPVDVQVTNDYVYRRNRNPHKIYGYLRTKELVAIVARFLPVPEESRLQKTRRFLKKLMFPRGHEQTPLVNPPIAPTVVPNQDIILDRPQAIAHLKEQQSPWDFVIIGGGATGMGVAVEAASRGYKTLLVEKYDFGKGTSSRSTKLVHGGVRYLQQGNISLVLEALREREIMRSNAPHLVHDLPFIVPAYDWWEGPFYGVGLKLYDMLAGKHGFGPSVNLSPEETLEKIPKIETQGLRGGVQYHDGQFDDARLVINLAQTAADEGATVVNYASVRKFSKTHGEISGVVICDELSGDEICVNARCVVNATGPFTDIVRQMDDPSCPAMMKASRGVHIVLDRSFLGGDTAIMVPHTDDGRVLFAIPWLDRVIIGTTDTPVEALDVEPVAHPDEISFILSCSVH